MVDNEVVMPRKVRYIAGSACELHKPLTDGRMEFVAGIVYTIEDYADYVRLVASGDFEEVDPPAPTPVVEVESASEVVQPKKVKTAQTGDNSN